MPDSVAADVPIVLAMVACWLVGVLVTGRSFSQGAGWAFLGLATRPGLERADRRVRRAGHRGRV